MFIVGSSMCSTMGKALTGKQGRVLAFRTLRVHNKLKVSARRDPPPTGKMTRETSWYPVAVATGLITAVTTITALLIKFI